MTRSVNHSWRRLIALGAVVALGTLPGAAWASSETDALISKLVEKKILTAEEAQDVRNEMAKDAGTIAKAREADTKDTASKMAGGSWLNTVKWSGDFRLRHETQLRDPSVTRHRERMRLRVGFKANPWDPLEIGVQLGTGASGDPISNNQSFANTFDKKAIFLDKAYAKYTPWPWAILTGGKMENPFQTTDIAWDPDTTPEGAVLQLKSPQAIPGLDQFLAMRPFATAGIFGLNEINASKADPAMYGAQGGADIDLPWGWTFQPSVAYYDYANIKGQTVTNVTSASAGAAGNTTTSGGAFSYDYNILDVLGRLNLPSVLGQPVTIVGDWVSNTAHSSSLTDGKIDNNGAWQAGLEVGKVTEKLGSWKATYYFKRLESNATFGPLTDSDFGGGGTNHFGHIMGVQMGLNKWASVALKYYRADEIIGTQNRNNTVQADMNMKF